MSADQRPPNPNPAWPRRRFSDRPDTPSGKVNRAWLMATTEYRLATFAPTVVALMVALIGRADRDTGRACVGRALLAEVIKRRSVRTVGRAMAELIDAGWVEVEHQVEHRMGRLRQRWNLYRLAIPDAVAEAITARRAEKAARTGPKGERPKGSRYRPPALIASGVAVTGGGVGEILRSRPAGRSGPRGKAAS